MELRLEGSSVVVVLISKQCLQGSEIGFLHLALFFFEMFSYFFKFVFVADARAANRDRWRWREWAWAPRACIDRISRKLHWPFGGLADLRLCALCLLGFCFLFLFFGGDRKGSWTGRWME
jgi:hypothetical protein